MCIELPTKKIYVLVNAQGEIRMEFGDEELLRLYMERRAQLNNPTALKPALLTVNTTLTLL